MKWEYHQWEVKTARFWDLPSRIPDHVTAELNRLGSEGWELVQAVPMARAGGRTDYVSFILKRALQ